MQKSKKVVPEPLKVISERGAWNGPAFRAPHHNAQQLVAIKKRAAEYGAANRSDPFAGARRLMYLLRGINDLSDKDTWQ